jgi:isochorismate hydrolase
LDVDRACVLVIDLQEKLLPLIAAHEFIIQASIKLIEGARVFGLPAIVTEQYPKGIGATNRSIHAALEKSQATILEKPTFSAWAHPPVSEALLEIDRPQVIVIGIEAHVCVQQTVLDLISRDFEVFVCADAVGSRGRMDYDRSLERMRQAGALIATVESVLFELCVRCDTSQFKEMIEVIKSYPPANGF